MVDLSIFTAEAPGDLVPIHGTDPRQGPWQHAAFVPRPLPAASPVLSPATHRVVADARAALAALDSTSRRLPNPRLFRRPSLQTEAQSTSALEGTYAPLAEVLSADEDGPSSPGLREVLNYVTMADTAFAWLEEGRPLSVSLLEDLQRTLVTGTASEGRSAGTIRDHQVVIGRRADAVPGDIPVRAAQFVPAPPGVDLHARVQDLLDWMTAPDGRREFDPVVAAALAHYQFETLHPFHDGNGRIGRLLIVAQLMLQRVLLEPTLTVSPWFEGRRAEYYDLLMGVSARGDWDSFIRFFATGLEASAQSTHGRMLALVAVQTELRDTVRRSRLRADSAYDLVDYAVAHVSFDVREIERQLNMTYNRANTLIGQLTALGVLAPLPSRGASRRFGAPRVMGVLLGEE